MVLCHALHQSIQGREWIETHEKLNEVSKQIGVQTAGQRVVGLGKVAWRERRSNFLLRHRGTGACLRQEVGFACISLV